MKKLSSRKGSNGDLRVEFRVNMPKYLSVNQRTIVEMLADEMGDQSANRVMNLGKARATSADGSSPSTANDHKDEGFLKNMWHTMTGQHDHLNDQQEPKKDDNPREEPKKASGSG